jgi:hypothetical protein
VFDLVARNLSYCIRLASFSEEPMQHVKLAEACHLVNQQQSKPHVLSTLFFLGNRNVCGGLLMPVGEDIDVSVFVLQLRAQLGSIVLRHLL